MDVSHESASPVVPVMQADGLIAHVPAAELLQAEASFRRGEDLNSELRTEDDPNVNFEIDLENSFATFHFKGVDVVLTRRAVLDASQELRSSTLLAHQATPAYSASDILLDSTGTRLAHLDIKPSELAQHIIVVGDPARALQLGSEYLPEIEVQRLNRGLSLITGYLPSGLRVSIVTHGMGAGSTEIVMNELNVLVSVDFSTMKLRPLEEVPELKMIRIGTCGAIQADSVLGQPIVTVAATSLDVGSQFFHSVNPATTPLAAKIAEITREHLNQLLNPEHPLFNHLPVACFEPSNNLLSEILKSADELNCRITPGVTFTAPGLNHTQGREIGGKAAAIPALDRVLADIELPNHLRFTNFEMEAATILALAGQFRHSAGAICVPVAQRATERSISAAEFKKGLAQAANIAFRTLEKTC